MSVDLRKVLPSVLYNTEDLGIFYGNEEKMYKIFYLRRVHRDVLSSEGYFTEYFEAFKLFMKDGQIGYLVGKVGNMSKMVKKIEEVLDKTVSVYFYTSQSIAQEYKEYNFITKCFTDYYKVVK